VCSLEQLLLDVELFRRCVRLRRGIDGPLDLALEEAVEDVLDEVGPAGDFIARPATRRATHEGTWHLDRLGVRDTWERWQANGRPDQVDDARADVERRLAAHEPPPLDEHAARELAAVVDRAAAADVAGPGVPAPRAPATGTPRGG
jgi:trimethylamine--corrinoid protein Co-methyltransferase